MLISKNYLKKIILEEINKTILEMEQKDIVINMPAKDYLELTTSEQIMNDIIRDYKHNIMRGHDPSTPIEYSEEKAGNLLLVINDYGDVTNHEGRHRAYANIVKNGEGAKNNVILMMNDKILGPRRYQEFLDNEYPFTGQYNKAIEKEPKDYPRVSPNN